MLATAALAGCALLGDEADDPFADVTVEAGPAVAYAVRFSGTEDAELLAALEAASQSATGTERPPASTFLLERRAEADLARLGAALRSLGHYDGSVTFEISTPAEPSPPVQRDGERPELPAAGRTAQETVLEFTVVPGPRYRLAALAIGIVPPTSGYPAPSPETLGLTAGQPATAQAVLDAEAALVRGARKAGHPFAVAEPRDAVIDRDARTMDVTLHLAPGPKARLGQPGFGGVDGVSAALLRRRVPFREGDLFDPELVERGRRNLIDTGLFSTVIVREASELDPEGRLAVTYEAIQRKHRSVGAGVGFQTDEGPNATLFAEHRNLFGAAERLRLDLYGSPARQELSAKLTKPDIAMRGLNLLGEGALRREETDAYDSLSIGGGVGLERVFNDRLRGSLGVAYRLARVEERGEPETDFALLSMPGKLDWDVSNSLLDPTRGGRVAVQTAPYVDTLDPSVRFWKSRLTATRYVPLTGEDRLVLALRGSVGSILGADRDDIPADERFYAGGGGSVRGFGYQLAGPLDSRDDPVGGRSILELNGELRLRATATLGAVAFLDAGTAFDSVYPDLAEELRYGTGVGLRYITPIGPLRLDIGVPLNPRSGVDDPWQAYVSIGQAF